MKEVFSHKTLREQVAIILRKRILSGHIKPGEKIKEVEISKEFNISRGPVREALRQIEQEGLIEYSANRGCTVKTLSPARMTEVYFIRSTLETLAVRIYSGNIRKSMVEKLDIIAGDIGAAAKRGDLNGIVENDEKFHETIVKEAGTDRLLKLWKNFEGDNAAAYYTIHEKGTIPSYERLEYNHRIIVEAFRTGKSDTICEVIQNHYMIVPECLKKKLIDSELQNKEY